MDCQLLQTLSAKLGVTDKNYKRKAEELLRLLAVQCGAGLTLSTSAKTVICLDIAASGIDKNTAIKLSGLTRPQYVSSHQTVNRLLKISPSVLISDLCVTYSATNAKDLALQIIKEYEQELQNKNEVDLSLPVFQTAAVVAACGVLKIKVDKRRMYESSCSKRAVYAKVVEAMTKIAETLHSKKAIKPGTKRAKTLLDMVEDNLQDSSSPKNRKCVSDDAGCSDQEDQENDFDAWKKKILAAAAASE